jgi:hypothetical protein
MLFCPEHPWDGCPQTGSFVESAERLAEFKFNVHHLSRTLLETAILCYSSSNRLLESHPKSVLDGRPDQRSLE